MGYLKMKKERQIKKRQNMQKRLIVKHQIIKYVFFFCLSKALNVKLRDSIFSFIFGIHAEILRAIPKGFGKPNPHLQLLQRLKSFSI